MATPVEAPKLGNTVEECLVVQWRKGRGDAVAIGDIVVEIESDKAAFEVSAPVAGTVLETFFAEGALVPVFTNLFVIGNPGEDAEAFRPLSASPNVEISSPASSDPVAQTATLAEPRVVSALPASSPSLSPRARRFAAEHGLQPGAISGSGPGGRVLEDDLRRLHYSLPAAPMSRTRQTIARRMRESLATTAQYTLHSYADAAGLLALRKKIKSPAGQGIAPDRPHIGIGDMVAFCAVKALLEFPDLNAEWIDGGIRKHTEIHLGFACDTPRGLMVPVVRDAHNLRLSELARRMKELTAQALGGTILPGDLTGGTFTISNLGSLGIESFTPLINPPQVAVLGVDAIYVKPVRREWDGAVTFIDAIGFSLTCDHQAIDGAHGARFLQVLKKTIESVESQGAVSGVR